jgi:hypothetical protein
MTSTATATATATAARPIALRRPSKEHATCAWCGSDHPDIVSLLAHVDLTHLPAATAA